MGIFVEYVTNYLASSKFDSVTYFILQGKLSTAFFTLLAFCLLYSFVAGLLCWIEPAAAGSGIPEIKAYLNGINLNKVVRIRVLYTKVSANDFNIY
jgi:chloride channel 7